ncbi:MAG: LPS assembly lipoprotein LptE [Litoreibacter sp.]
MSSFNRRFLLLSLPALAACGFEPVYGTNGSSKNLRGSVLVDEPTGRDSFQMLEHLEKRLGRAQTPKYGLMIETTIEEEGLAISGSNNIDRFNLIGEANYTLRNLDTNKAVLADKVSTFTAYSASLQPVATLAAQRDARRRLMLALADRIVADLLSRPDAL